MAVAGELVGVSAATLGTLPVDRTSLATDPTGTALGPSKLGCDFLLRKLLEHQGHPVDDDLLHLGLYGLKYRSTLLCL